MAWGQNIEFKFETKVDLNSDGKIDNISLLELGEESGKFQLKINDAFATGNLNDPIDGFLLIDITTWDKYKEIAVHTPGPSSDDIYMIYWYNGKEIILMDSLSRWPTFTGNGIIYVNTWEGFWSPREKFKLNNSTRKLNIVEQSAYYVGLKTKVNKGFHIYYEKDLVKEVALLADGSEIEILVCDKKDREYFNYLYLIKSSSGLLGWCSFREFSDKVELPMAD